MWYQQVINVAIANNNLHNNSSVKRYHDLPPLSHSKYSFVYPNDTHFLTFWLQSKKSGKLNTLKCITFLTKKKSLKSLNEFLLLFLILQNYFKTIWSTRFIITMYKIAQMFYSTLYHSNDAPLCLKSYGLYL